MPLKFRQNFQHLSIVKITSVLLSIAFSFQVLAVQPMSESDLEVVSATTGSNILNIFGASQAGLKIADFDANNTTSSLTKIKADSINEGEATKPAALKALRSLEDEIFQVPNTNNTPSISNDAQATLLKINEQTKGSASLFSTNSEINYKTTNFQHDMRKTENGGVAISRDLQIDLLKIENLKGANLDESRSAGSVYLSDWRSQGDTRIMSSK